ncbi:MAG TPA: hypothetical protein VGF08_11350, partial [Terriglobales bacterium]
MDDKPTSSIVISDVSAPIRKEAVAEPCVHGSLLVLMQFDVCEEIRLDQLKEIVGARRVEASFKNAAPSYVRYERAPVVEPLDSLVLDTGERLEGQIKYFDYGVVSLIFELPFSGDWDTLVKLSSRWVWNTDFERQALRVARQRLERVAPALVKPYPYKDKEWLDEDYFIFQVREIKGSPSANELLTLHGDQIAQIIRGENTVLAEGERAEALQGRISYYPNDLAVIGWNGAFIYDTASGAETAVQLLEYANSQLLEFRHYDELLTRELSGVYDFLEEGRGILGRWKLARAASRLHTVLLDVMELTERVDNAIKFLSDMFSARLYKLSASRVGVPDYKNLVNQKIQTAEELYRFMVDQFHQG